MTRRICSLLCRGAATALFAWAAPTMADSDANVTSLPQWVQRAQERLGLQPDQQLELRALIDGNAERLLEMRERLADDPSGKRRAQSEEMTALQLEFRAGLMQILTPGQLTEWDALIEELLGQVHLRNAPLLVNSAH